MEHTKEPWAAKHEFHIEGGDRRGIASTGSFSDCTANCSAENAANRNRIVQCVNAMEGIEDPARLRKNRDDLLVERDELLAALQATREFVRDAIRILGV